MLDALAERQRSCGEGVPVHVIAACVHRRILLVVEGYGKVELAAAKLVKHEVGLFLRLLGAGGLRVKVHASLQAGIGCSCKVLAQAAVREQTALGGAAVAGSHKGELDSIACNLLPVDGALHFGHVDSRLRLLDPVFRV